jgi:hypothetical protein
MDPVLGGKVVDRQQLLQIISDLRDRLRELRPVSGREAAHGVSTDPACSGLGPGPSAGSRVDGRAHRTDPDPDGVAGADLSAELSTTLDGLRRSRARHDPGRVLVDLAVAVADGATTISEIAVLADQQALSGSAASDSMCWRLLDRLDDIAVAAIAAARARAREVVRSTTPRPVGGHSRRCGSPAASWTC